MPEQNEQPTLEHLAAERDLWRARYLAAHEVIAAVEQLFDLGVDWRTPAAGSVVNSGALRDVQASFEAWRKLAEAGTPTLWQVAE